MKRLVIFMHASLDGFVAGPKGEMDWISVDNAMFDYAGKRTEESDMALYGRITYQMMEAYWPTAANQPNATKHDIEHGNWYNQVEKVIVSKSMKDAVKAKTRFIGENVMEEIKKLKQESGKDIIVFGSPSVIHELTKAGLVDDFWIFVNPVLLGKGIPLFDKLEKPQKLELAETNTFPSGVVCMHYRKLMIP
jgi:dihydrofolate reductase